MKCAIEGCPNEAGEHAIDVVVPGGYISSCQAAVPPFKTKLRVCDWHFGLVSVKLRLGEVSLAEE